MELLFILVVVAGLYVIYTLVGRVNYLRRELASVNADLESTYRTSNDIQVKLNNEIAHLTAALKSTNEAYATQASEALRLKPFTTIADLAEACSALETRLLNDELNAKTRLQKELDSMRESQRSALASEIASMKSRVAKAEANLAEAGQQAEQIISDAKVRAEQIAGDAYKALANIDSMKKVADALRNRIEGYKDRYIIPTYTLTDELADSYGFVEAGAALKRARALSKLMVEQGRAAKCDYVEANRAGVATAFVLDAFDGKLDSILSRLKADNYGTLRQQVIDAFALVNNNGQAFRNARITDDYLAARLEEVKHACTVAALRDRDREEQRRIREQIREEERAQKEFERAKRDAERDEQVARRTLEKLEAQLRAASEEQKAVFEEKLREMQGKLAEAEAKSQRALSMAQQTKAGNVYVISNIGSFGEDVFKIGMTRRLEPLDRVAELGDASVPFPFDVHGMIYSENAPALEHKLHQQFLVKQINKVNPRKEFFQLSLCDIQDAVSKLGIPAQWTVRAAAAQYRESLSIAEKIESDVKARREWELSQLKVEAAAFTDETTDELA